MPAPGRPANASRVSFGCASCLLTARFLVACKDRAEDRHCRTRRTSTRTGDRARSCRLGRAATQMSRRATRRSLCHSVRSSAHLVNACSIPANPGCRNGRQPAVTPRGADCCIAPAVHKSMCLDADAASAALPLREAKQQRPPGCGSARSDPARSRLSKRTAAAAAHRSDSGRTRRRAAAAAQTEASTWGWRLQGSS